MSELASTYPTSEGTYWWASKLGGAKAGFADMIALDKENPLLRQLVHDQSAGDVEIVTSDSRREITCKKDNSLCNIFR
jgi:hypothetical protein